MKIFICILLIISLTACNNRILPTYTNVERISNCKTGMEVTEVIQELGIEPYDMFYKEDNSLILVFHYRVKNKIMRTNRLSRSQKHDTASQYEGIDWYGKSYKCYTYFSGNRLQMILTDPGKEKSEEILLNARRIEIFRDENAGY